MHSSRRLAQLVIGIIIFPVLIVAIIAGYLGRSELPQATPLADLTLMPIATDNFETFDFAWQLGDGWAHNPINEGGMALVLFGPPNSPTRYGSTLYEDVAVSFRLQVEAGEARLYIRRSAAGMLAILLDAAGQAKIYRNAELLGEAPYPVAAAGWNHVQFIAVKGDLLLTVNDEAIISVTDDTPLPAGTIAFDGAGIPVRVTIDDFALAVPVS